MFRELKKKRKNDIINVVVMYDNKFEDEILNLFFSLLSSLILFLFDENIDDNDDKIKIDEDFLFKKFNFKNKN